MPMDDEPDAYQAYLLRLWRTLCQGQWQWRASIESRRTGEHQVFGSLETLFAFLSERCADSGAGTTGEKRNALLSAPITGKEVQPGEGGLTEQA